MIKRNKKVVFSLELRMSDLRRKTENSSLDMVVDWNGIDITKTNYSYFNDALFGIRLARTKLSGSSHDFLERMFESYLYTRKGKIPTSDKTSGTP